MGIHAPAVFLNQLSAAGEATGNRQQAPVLIPVVGRGWTMSTGLPPASPGMYLHGFRLRVELPSVQLQLSG